MKDQEVKNIHIKDLVLWTENPRDPIVDDATDQDIVSRALDDKNSKWTLTKLVQEMGEYYDFSELPTVVYHGDKPVVYDGNRRIILVKIKHGLVKVDNKKRIKIPDFPQIIPCNVCREKIALINVYRKHKNSGSWDHLERDIFLHKFMGEKKSLFQILDEDTGIISSNPHMNKRFVKEEIFREDILKSLGFFIKNGRLHSVHNNKEAFSILTDISKKIEKEEISTRRKRGKILEVLEPSSQKLIDQNKNKKSRVIKVQFNESEGKNKNPRLSKRTAKMQYELFGGKLYLQIGEVSNLYRDIIDLYQFWVQNKNGLSQTFPGLIRMSLRLLCETAASGKNKKMDDFLKNNYPKAKETLDKDLKTTLSNQNVNENSIVQLLQTGAHNYKSSSNLEQTIAISIIIGRILNLAYGRE